MNNYVNVILSRLELAGSLPIKVTFILKNLSQEFYEGSEFGPITGFNEKTPEEKFRYLLKDPTRFPCKIASGQFKDKVELNSILKGPCAFDYSLGSRAGYKLATFMVRRILLLPGKS